MWDPKRETGTVKIGPSFFWWGKGGEGNLLFINFVFKNKGGGEGAEVFSPEKRGAYLRGCAVRRGKMRLNWCSRLETRL